MKIRYAYEGTLDDIKGVWTDELPDGVIVEKEVIFLTADDSEHTLQNKETKEKRSSVIIQDKSEQENWEEVEHEEPTFAKENLDG